MDFNLQPHLYGNLLFLRPLQENDFEELYNLASDPLLWELHPEKDRYRREVFSKFLESAMDSRGALVAMDKKNQKIIGCTRYYGYKASEKEITIGYSFLSRAYWGGVYNFEMKTLMLDHAYNYVETVTFLVGENNFRSRRAVEKLGAELRKHAEGQVSYGLSKQAWSAQKIKGLTRKIKHSEFILYVSSQDTSAMFYEKVLGIKPSLNVPGMTEFELSDSCKLGLMPNDGIARVITPPMPHPASANGVPRCELYLLVEQLNHFFENAIKNGAGLISAPANRDWGHRVCYVSDPDGHVLAFAEEIKQ